MNFSKLFKSWLTGTRSNARRLGHEAPRQRLFTIFEVPDNSRASRVALRAMLEADLQWWGYDERRAQTYANNVLERVDGKGPLRVKDLSELAATDDEDLLAEAAHEVGDGVTVADLRWYWSLSPTSRSAMEEFDSEIFGHLWLDLHPFHLCVEDLEQDTRRRLPDFGSPLAPLGAGADAPLRPELRKRWVEYYVRTKKDPQGFEAWRDRLRQSTSINALIRELISEGSL